MASELSAPMASIFYDWSIPAASLAEVGITNGCTLPADVRALKLHQQKALLSTFELYAQRTVEPQRLVASRTMSEDGFLKCWRHLMRPAHMQGSMLSVNRTRQLFQSVLAQASRTAVASSPGRKSASPSTNASPKTNRSAMLRASKSKQPSMRRADAEWSSVGKGVWFRPPPPGLSFGGFCELLVTVAQEWHALLRLRGGLKGASFEREAALAVLLTRCGLAASEAAVALRIERAHALRPDTPTLPFNSRSMVLRPSELIDPSSVAAAVRPSCGARPRKLNAAVVPHSSAVVAATLAAQREAARRATGRYPGSMNEAASAPVSCASKPGEAGATSGTARQAPPALSELSIDLCMQLCQPLQHVALPPHPPPSDTARSPGQASRQDAVDAAVLADEGATDLAADPVRARWTEEAEESARGEDGASQHVIEHERLRALIRNAVATMPSTADETADEAVAVESVQSELEELATPPKALDTQHAAYRDWRRRIVRNRWRLCWMLHQHPYLKKYRGHALDKASLTPSAEVEATTAEAAVSEVEASAGAQVAEVTERAALDTGPALEFTLSGHLARHFAVLALLRLSTRTSAARSQRHETLLARQEHLMRRVERLEKRRSGQSSPEPKIVEALAPAEGGRSSAEPQTVEDDGAEARTAARDGQKELARAEESPLPELEPTPSAVGVVPWSEGEDEQEVWEGGASPASVMSTCMKRARTTSSRVKQPSSSHDGGDAAEQGGEAEEDSTNGEACLGRATPSPLRRIPGRRLQFD